MATKRTDIIYGYLKASGAYVWARFAFDDALVRQFIFQTGTSAPDQAEMMALPYFTPPNALGTSTTTGNVLDPALLPGGSFTGFVDGSFNLPGAYFTNEPGTGFYRAGAGQIGVELSGVNYATFTTSLHTVLTQTNLDLGLANGALPAAINAGVNLQLGNVNAQVCAIQGDGFGNSACLHILSRNSGGTRGSPTFTNLNSILFNLGVFGFGVGTVMGTAAAANYQIRAGSVWTVANQETVHQWLGTPATSILKSTWMTLDGIGLTVGVAKTGTGVFGLAEWSHSTGFGAAGTYALLQSSVGQTILNAASGQTLSLRIANADIGVFSAAGLALASGVNLKLGNTRAAGVLVQGGSVTMLDAAGTTITVLTT